MQQDTILLHFKEKTISIEKIDFSIEEIQDPTTDVDLSSYTPNGGNTTDTAQSLRDDIDVNSNKRIT